MMWFWKKKKNKGNLPVADQKKLFMMAINTRLDIVNEEIDRNSSSNSRNDLVDVTVLYSQNQDPCEKLTKMQSLHVERYHYLQLLENIENLSDKNNSHHFASSKLAGLCRRNKRSKIQSILNQMIRQSHTLYGPVAKTSCLDIARQCQQAHNIPSNMTDIYVKLNQIRRSIGTLLEGVTDCNSFFFRKFFSARCKKKEAYEKVFEQINTITKVAECFSNLELTTKNTTSKRSSIKNFWQCSKTTMKQLAKGKKNFTKQYDYKEIANILSIQSLQDSLLVAEKASVTSLSRIFIYRDYKTLNNLVQQAILLINDITQSVQYRDMQNNYQSMTLRTTR